MLLLTCLGGIATTLCAPFAAAHLQKAKAKPGVLGSAVGTVAVDNAVPALLRLNPAPNATDVSINLNSYQFDVEGGSGVTLASINVTLEGGAVITNGVVQADFNEATSVTVIAGGYHVNVVRDESLGGAIFDYGQQLDWTVAAEDATGHTVNESYFFTIAANMSSFGIANNADSRVDNSDFDEPGLDLTTQYTLCFWLEPRTLIADRFIAFKGSGSNFQTRIQTSVANADEWLAVKGASSNFVQTTNANLAVNVPSCLCERYDGSQATPADRLDLFTNGIENTETVTGVIPASVTNNANTWRLGAVNTTLHSYIDEPALWNVPLSDADILSHCGGGVPSNPRKLSPSNLVLWWQADGDVAGANGVTDHSPGGLHDGRLFGATIEPVVP